MRTITAIMGDGIGPEVMEATMRVVDATGVLINWEKVYAGQAALDKTGSPLPQETLDSITRNKVALKGPCDTPIGSGFKSVNVKMRQLFDTYFIPRLVVSMPGVKSRFSDVNLIVLREGVEDIYAGDEDGDYEKGIIHGVITRKNSTRFFERVFDYAKINNRKHVTIVHKANIIKHAYGLFLRVGLEVAERYPEIKVDSKIVDDMCMKLVMNPNQFDVIAAPNMFGDIVSELCAGLVGGLGVVSGANLGDKYAIFEAGHGTAPDIAGKGIANPTALILSAAMMLEYIGESKACAIIVCAVNEVLFEGKYITKDITHARNEKLRSMGYYLPVSTDRMTDAIVEQVKRRL